MLVTEGEVISAVITKQSGRYTTYPFKICYRYAIGENVYYGDRVSFYDEPSYRVSRVYAANYGVGSKVAVFYDSWHPNRSVLLREVPLIIWLLLGLSLTLVCGACWNLCDIFIKMKRA